MSDETTLTAEQDTPLKPEDVIYDKKDSEGEKPEEETVETAEAEEADEDSSEDDSGDDESDPEKDDEEASGAPEKYEEFQLPDGMDLDEAAMAQFLPIAKELDLSQEQAQKLVTMYSENLKAQTSTVETEYSEVRANWVKEIKADKTFGGKNYDENVGLARQAVKTFGSPELVELLNATGLGDNPAVVKHFIKLGKSMKEDGVLTGSAPAGSKDLAKILFPNQN